MKEINVNGIKIGKNNPLVLIGGPCVLEEEKGVLTIAEQLVKTAEQYHLPLIFKASYEKDNRSTSTAYKGPGLEKGLRLLKKIKDQFRIPILSDVHRETDIEQAREVLDIIQIPAFLCQQTSLLLKAGQSGRVINIKKGQFLAPENMKSAVEKVESTNNHQILLTERGTTFGYNYLVADMCAIPVMQELGYPVVFDATHIIRCYGYSSKDARGGRPQFIGHLARAGVAAGCDALFLETHIDPASALCDAASMLNLSLLPGLLEQVIPISAVIRDSRR